MHNDYEKTNAIQPKKINVWAQSGFLDKFKMIKNFMNSKKDDWYRMFTCHGQFNWNIIMHVCVIMNDNYLKKVLRENYDRKDLYLLIENLLFPMRVMSFLFPLENACCVYHLCPFLLNVHRCVYFVHHHSSYFLGYFISSQCKEE